MQHWQSRFSPHHKIHKGCRRRLQSPSRHPTKMCAHWKEIGVVQIRSVSHLSEKQVGGSTGDKHFSQSIHVTYELKEYLGLGRLQLMSMVSASEWWISDSKEQKQYMLAFNVSWFLKRSLIVDEFVHLSVRSVCFFNTMLIPLDRRCMVSLILCHIDVLNIWWCD